MLSLTTIYESSICVSQINTQSFNLHDLIQTSQKPWQGSIFYKSRNAIGQTLDHMVNSRAGDMYVYDREVTLSQLLKVSISKHGWLDSLT